MDSTNQTTISKRSWSRVIKLSFPQHIHCIPNYRDKGQDSIRCYELGAEVQDQEKVFQTLFVCLLIAFANCGAPFSTPLLATNTYYDQLFYCLNLKECFALCQSAMICCIFFANAWHEKRRALCCFVRPQRKKTKYVHFENYRVLFISVRLGSPLDSPFLTPW